MTAALNARRRVIAVATAAASVDLGGWLVYQFALGAPSRAFYPMAAACFVVVPIVGAAIAARYRSRTRGRAFAAVFGGVTGAQVLAFIVGYAFVPYFAAVATVDTPPSCDGSYTNNDRRIRIDGRTMISLIEERDVLVTAEVDATTRASTVRLIRTTDHTLLFSISYPDDNIAVAVSPTTVFLFNEALGTLIDRDTGARTRRLVSIDSYGRNVPDSFENTGIFGWRGTFETTGYFSIWRRDGSVELLQKLTFSGIQNGCLIDGPTGAIHKL